MPPPLNWPWPPPLNKPPPLNCPLPDFCHSGRLNPTAPPSAAGPKAMVCLLPNADASCRILSDSIAAASLPNWLSCFTFWTAKTWSIALLDVLLAASQLAHAAAPPEEHANQHHFS